MSKTFDGMSWRHPWLRDAENQVRDAKKECAEVAAQVQVECPHPVIAEWRGWTGSARVCACCGKSFEPFLGSWWGLGEHRPRQVYSVPSKEDLKRLLPVARFT